MNNERRGNTFLVKLWETSKEVKLEIVSISETHQANRRLTETNVVVMSTVCARDVNDGVETSVGVSEESAVRITNMSNVEIGKGGVITGGETHTQQTGVRDVKGDPGENHSSSCVGDYCDQMSVISLAAKVKGVKENTSNIDNRKRTTSETLTPENTEDDCIVDFLDKSNEKVYLSLSHP